MPLKRARSGDPVLLRDDVEFPMEDTTTGKRMLCKISKYALEDRFEDRGYWDSTFIEPRFPGHMQIFLMFRDAIEKEQSDMYDRRVKAR